MATIDDVVRLSGISRSTVFRFLNGSNVRPQVRESIQTAMRELNYFYNPRHSRSDILFVISVKERFEGMNALADIVSGVMSRSSTLGIHVAMHAEGGPLVPEPSGQVHRWKRLGALLIGKSAAEEEAEAAELGARGIPHVFINRVFPNRGRSFVSVDIRAAASAAVGHLLDLGYAEIGTWGLPGLYSLDREKLEGYKDAFAARGLEPSGPLLVSDTDQDLEDEMRKLFSTSRRPRAFFGLTDATLMRLGSVLRELGLSVPADVALAGMDDIESSRYFSPPLTTVRIPFRRAGSSAVDLLLGLVEDPERVSEQLILRHELVIRESCGGRRGPSARGAGCR